MKITFAMRDMTGPLVLDYEGNVDALVTSIKDAMAGGHPLEITDAKGERTIISGAALAYAQIGTEQQRKVGFGRP